jgi:peptide/nickel transport system substrate-binding protein
VHVTTPRRALPREPFWFRILCISIRPACQKLPSCVEAVNVFPRLRRGIALLLVAWACVACHSAPATPPGYIVVGLENGPITLDPRFATDATAAQIGDLLFDGLTRLDSQSRRLPHLAESWETPDDRTYVFHLQEGFRFADGQPLTATDVQATYDSVRDARAQSAKRQALEPIEAVDVLDPLTVRFRLREPFAPFMEETGLGILSARQIAKAPTRPLVQPLGSGPFQLTEFALDERVVAARNNTYPLGRPRLAGVIFKVVPDAVSRLLELKRGSLDLVQNGIEPDALGWVREQPRLSVMTSPGTTFQYIGINLRESPLADVRVRRAIAHAIDRDAIVDTILKGLATVATGLLPPTHWAYDPHVVTYAYNPKRAKQLLDLAGYPDPDGDGPAPRFHLSYKTTTVELRRRIAEVLQGQLAQVGIALDIRSYEWATFYNDIRKGDFQLYSLAWVGIEDPDIYYQTCHSSQVPPLGNNRGYFHEETVDQLTEAARRTSDIDERRRLYAEVQRRVAQLLPVIPLWWTTNVAVMDSRLQGYELQPNASYVSLRNAWIEER